MEGKFTRGDALWRGSEEGDVREVRKLKRADGPDPD
jgi:hypothetical protein